MNTVKAHYNGHAFVPEEAVDVPVGWVGTIRYVSLADEMTAPPKKHEPNPLEDFYCEPEDCPLDDGLPTDLSINYKHYLYGAPKRD